MLASLTTFAFLRIAPVLTVRLDESMRAALQQTGELAGAVESSFVPARLGANPATLTSFVPATFAPPAQAASEAMRGKWQDSRMHAYIWDLDPRDDDSFSARDISRKVDAAVKANRVTFFQGRVGDSTMRFGVVKSKLMPRPILVAETLEGNGAEASWVSLPVMQFRRREDVVGARQWNSAWSGDDVAMAKELLGTWAAPSAPFTRAVTALQGRPLPNFYEFELNDQRRWIVTADGAEPSELEPMGLTFEGNVDDALQQVRSGVSPR